MHKTESERDIVKFITVHVQHYRKFILFLRELLQFVGILGFLLLNFFLMASASLLLVPQLSLPWVAAHNFSQVLKFKLEKSESTVGLSVQLVFKRAVGV